MRMLENVQQKTIEPVIRAGVAEGTRFYTDEYDIYARLPAWGYDHRTVCHSRGEYARDEDGDGFREVHVNTIEGRLVVAALLAPPAPRHLPGESPVVYLSHLRVSLRTLA